MTEKIIEIRTLITDNVKYLDYSDYERRLQMIEMRGRLLELRYNHNHDEKGRFCSGGGGGRMSSSSSSSENSEKSLDKSEKSDIIKLNDIEIGRSIGAKAKNYDIMDLQTGEHYNLVEGTRLQDVEVFAGKGTKTPFRKAEKYAKKYGGKAKDWQHVKGKGTVDYFGEGRDAELHWVQCQNIGKHDFFIKRWLE